MFNNKKNAVLINQNSVLFGGGS